MSPNKPFILVNCLPQVFCHSNEKLLDTEPIMHILSQNIWILYPIDSRKQGGMGTENTLVLPVFSIGSQNTIVSLIKPKNQDPKR